MVDVCPASSGRVSWSATLAARGTDTSTVTRVGTIRPRETRVDERDADESPILNILRADRNDK